MRVSRTLRLHAEWAFPIRTLVGTQSRLEIPKILAGFGARRPLVVTDNALVSQGFFQSLIGELQERHVEPVVFSNVHPNPLDTDVIAGVDAFKQAGADSVVCVGGGSGLDAGKCIAMQAESGYPLSELDYFSESKALNPGYRLVPCITVPTTAGTGAEMDSGSMYTDTSAGIKRCAGHVDLPLVAVLDPELTLGLPPALTAWTGMDALVHAVEAFFVPVYHPMCDGIALEALRKIRASLPVAYSNSSSIEARTEMLVASAMAAVSFQKGLGAVHGLSEPIGAVYGPHHGLTNAVLLPFILRDLGDIIEEPCHHIARALGLPTSGKSAHAVINLVDELNVQFKIPRSLKELTGSLDDAAMQSLAAKAAANPTGFTNIVRYEQQDYLRVLRAALG